MRRFSSLAAALLLLVAAVCSEAVRLPFKTSLEKTRLPQAPSWPKSYSVSYVLSLPFTAEVQSSMVKYPVQFHKFVSETDSSMDKIRMDTLDGVNMLIASKNVEYELTPRLNEQVCRSSNVAKGEDSTYLSALPSIADWAFEGSVGLEIGFNYEEDAQLWQYERRHENKVVKYKFYVSADGRRPLRLHMHGNDIFSGAHFDEWIADYVDYKPDAPDSAVFDPPQGCEEPDEKENKYQKHLSSSSGATLRMRHLIPAVQYGGEHAAYDEFLTTTGHGRGRRHASLQDYRRRVRLFSENLDKITAHNTAAVEKPYKMAMNKFGDWSREEFLAVMLPRHSKKKENEGENGVEQHQRELGKHEVPYAPLTDISKIPTSIDWRGTGANSGGVKDQANCGSCWAFASVGAMEAAWFHATGQSTTLSEQQVMDCSWGFVPGAEDSASACDGGDAWAGVGHTVDAGGLSFAENYQYLGQNDFCREEERTEAVTLNGAKFKGYARIPRYNESALMEAVYSRGPIAVALDASQDSFTFYSSGIYYESACLWKPSDLDHAMMLVGYGTEAAGDYWLIKNSWSRHWGDGGYVKVARDGHGCGAASDAMYVIADANAVTTAAAGGGDGISVQ